MVLEAMATGLPVIASDVSGNTQLVRDGQSGFLCALDDETAFANALVNLASNAQQRQHFGHAARRIAETEYSWDTSRAGISIFFVPRNEILYPRGSRD